MHLFYIMTDGYENNWRFSSYYISKTWICVTCCIAMNLEGTSVGWISWKVPFRLYFESPPTHPVIAPPWRGSARAARQVPRDVTASNTSRMLAGQQVEGPHLKPENLSLSLARFRPNKLTPAGDSQFTPFINQYVTHQRTEDTLHEKTF